MNSLFSKKISIPYIIGFVLVTALVTFFITNYIEKKEQEKIIELSQANSSCAYKVERLEGYPHIKPLLFVDDVCEGDGLASLKVEMNTIIENYKNYQGVISASVYLKDFSANEWEALQHRLIQLYAEAYRIDFANQMIGIKKKLQSLLEKLKAQETRFKLKALVNQLDIETQFL